MISNITFSKVYTILISFLPLFTIFSIEANMSNFYISTSYISFLLILGIARLWKMKSLEGFSFVELMLGLLCVLSFISGLLNGFGINQYIYYCMLSSFLLIWISKNIVKNDFLLLKKSFVFILLLINTIILGGFFTNTDIVVYHTSNIGIVAIYISISICIAMYIINKTHSMRIKIPVILLIILDFYSLYLIKCRTSYIVLVCFFLTSKTIPQKGHRILLSIIFLIIVTYVSCYNISKGNSFLGRLYILDNCLCLFKDNPIIGCGGIGSFCVKYQLQQSYFFASHQEFSNRFMLADNVLYANNEYVQLFCELGILGAAIIICFLYFILKNNKGIIEYSIFFPVVVSAFFYYVLHTALFFSIILISIIIMESQDSPYFTFNGNRFIKGCILSTSVFLTCYFVNHYTISLKINDKINSAHLNESQKKYILERFTENKQMLMKLVFVCNEGSCQKYSQIEKNFLHSDLLFEEAKHLRKEKNNKMAKEKLKLASNICPNRFRYRYEMFKIYREEKNISQAIRMACFIKQMPVKVQSPTVMAIKSDINNYLKMFKQ